MQSYFQSSEGSGAFKSALGTYMLVGAGEKRRSFTVLTCDGLNTVICTVPYILVTYTLEILRPYNTNSSSLHSDYHYGHGLKSVCAAPSYGYRAGQHSNNDKIKNTNNESQTSQQKNQCVCSLSLGCN